MKTQARDLDKIKSSSDRDKPGGGAGSEGSTGRRGQASQVASARLQTRLGHSRAAPPHMKSFPPSTTGTKISTTKCCHD